jgi:hypothetical protein
MRGIIAEILLLGGTRKFLKEKHRLFYSEEFSATTDQHLL